MELVIDILLLAIVGGLTFLVGQDGPWNAILTFFAVIFGGLLAMNFYEPLAIFLSRQSPALETRADFVCMVGLFALFVTLIRLGLEHLAPTNIELPEIAYKIGQWAFGFGSAYITMAILLTSLHTAPLPRKFFGFTPERKNFLGITSPDVQWLGFTQHVTEHVFARRSFDSKGMVAYRNFDGMRMVFPDQHQPAYLPTFIIRHATRRKRLSGEMAAAAAPPPIVVPAGPAGPGGPPVGPAF